VDSILSAKYSQRMSRTKKSKKPLSVAEAGRRGGQARAAKHSKEEIRNWAQLGGWPKGRPRKPTPKAKPEEPTEDSPTVTLTSKRGVNGGPGGTRTPDLLIRS